mmetsp:Transcript_20871/g.48903  ORF Transcript_20871/g.48903 Transcript_20871/m.48903 type:complete len:226 (+) Transcript_20871:484-1161(+)
MKLIPVARVEQFRPRGRLDGALDALALAPPQRWLLYVTRRWRRCVRLAARSALAATTEVEFGLFAGVQRVEVSVCVRGVRTAAEYLRARRPLSCSSHAACAQSPSSSTKSSGSGRKRLLESIHWMRSSAEVRVRLPLPLPLSSRPNTQKTRCCSPWASLRPEKTCVSQCNTTRKRTRARGSSFASSPRFSASGTISMTSVGSMRSTPSSESSETSASRTMDALST